MAEYVEETINRVKGSVKGIIIVNYNGGIVRSTFENNKRDSTINQLMQVRTMPSTSPSSHSRPKAWSEI